MLPGDLVVDSVAVITVVIGVVVNTFDFCVYAISTLLEPKVCCRAVSSLLSFFISLLFH